MAMEIEPPKPEDKSEMTAWDTVTVHLLWDTLYSFVVILHIFFFFALYFNSEV